MADDSQRMADARLVSQLLVQAAEYGKATFQAAATSLELPVPVARALLLLDQPAPMSDLAERLTCDRSYITSITDQLEEKGLVARVPGADRRVKLLELTEHGKKTRDVLAAVVADNSMVFHNLSDDDRLTLQHLLGRLVHNTELPLATD